jgi:hypothetical protein
MDASPDLPDPPTLWKYYPGTAKVFSVFLKTVPIPVALVSMIMDVIVALSFYAFVVGVFFFTAAAAAEKYAVKKNTDRAVAGIIGPLKTVLTPEQNSALGDMIGSTLKVPDMTQDDKNVAEANKRLVIRTMLTLSGVLAGGLLLVTIIWAITKKWATAKGKGNGKRIVKGEDYPNIAVIIVDNAIIAGVVFVTELVFLLIVGLSWRSIDVNALRLSMIDAVIDFAEKKPGTFIKV